jgi:hypothetical protein
MSHGIHNVKVQRKAKRLHGRANIYDILTGGVKDCLAMQFFGHGKHHNMR